MPDLHAALPQPVRGEIARAGRLNAAAAILLLTAPSGYGKTVMSAQFARESDKVPIWVRVTPTASDPLVLSDLIAAALVRQGINTAAWTKARTEALGPDTFKDALLTDLTGAPDCLLIFDNAETLSMTSAAFLNSLLTDLGPWHQVIVNTRPNSHIQLTSLLAAGRCEAVSDDTLRFTAEDTATYLSTTGSDPHADLSHLSGWPAAIALATLTGRHDQAISDTVETIISQMPPDLQDIALGASVLSTWDETTPTWLGLPPRPDWIREVARSGLPMTIHRRQARPHALVADILTDLLKRDHGRATDLHRRAAQAATTRGDPEQALRHHLAAGDTVAAAHTVQDTLLPRWQRHSDWGVAAETLELFPRSELPPTLTAVLGLAYGELGRTNDAQATFEAQLQRGEETATTYFGLGLMAYRKGDLPLLAAMVEHGQAKANTLYDTIQNNRNQVVYLLASNRYHEALDVARRTATLAQSAQDPALLIAARTSEFWALIVNKEWTEALELGRRLVTEAFALGFSNKATVVLDALITTARRTGHLQDVRAFTELMNRQAEEYPLMRARAAAHLGALAMMDRHAAQAVAHYARAIEFARQGGDKVWIEYASYLYLAAHVDHHHAEYDALLDEALSVASAGAPRAAVARWSQAIREMTAGRHAAAEQLLRQWNGSADPAITLVTDYLLTEVARATGQLTAAALDQTVRDWSAAGAGLELRVLPPVVWGAARQATRLNVQPHTALVFSHMLESATPPAPAELTVRTLGQYTCQITGLPVRIPRLALELLVYLAIHGAVSIDQLAADLAPHSREGRNRIHRAKADVHRATGLDLIVTTAGAQDRHYQLTATVPIIIDAVQLLSVTNAEEAYALYQGPFLPGAADDGWAAEIRERLNRRAASLYIREAERLRNEQSPEAARWYRRALRLTPWNAPVWRAYLQVSEALGHTADVTLALEARRELEAGFVPVIP